MTVGRFASKFDFQHESLLLLSSTKRGFVRVFILFIATAIFGLVLPPPASAHPIFDKGHFDYFNVGNVYVSVAVGVQKQFPLSDVEVKAIVCSNLKTILDEGKVVLWGCAQEPPYKYYPGGNETEYGPINKDLLVMRVGVSEPMGHLKQKFDTPIYVVSVGTNRMIPFRGYKGKGSDDDTYALVPFTGDVALFKEDFNNAVSRSVGSIARYVITKDKVKD